MKRQGAGMGMYKVLYVGMAVWGSCGGYPQDFLWVWDGYGDRNSVPAAVLPISIQYSLSTLLVFN